MKTFKSLQTYLNDKGVDGSTPPEKVAEFKVEYRKEYNAHFGREKRPKRINLSPNGEEYQKLSRCAEEAKLSVSRYVLDAAIAQSDSTLVVPNSDAIYELSRQVNAIGHNINAVVHTIHASKSYNDVSFYKDLSREVTALKKVVIDFLNEPLKLESAIRVFVEVYPDERITALNQYLAELKKELL